MSKQICAIVMIGIFFLFGTDVLAGDVPEGLFDDKALIFFGELISYDASSITVMPTLKIKGDVEIGIEQTYFNYYFIGYISPIPSFDIGEIYLMAYYDANNPLYVFRTTTTDTETLVIEGVAWYAMWGRMQMYLNEGIYEQLEAERLLRINESASSQEPTPTPIIPTPVPVLAQEPINNSQDLTNYWFYVLILAVIAVGAVIFLRKKAAGSNNRLRHPHQSRID